jgi:hypothetical protein
MSGKKSQLGQFYTTNFDYILKGMQVPLKSRLIEPFAGEGDLLKFASRFKLAHTECYDIDPKHDYITKRDTLKNPPDYDGKFVLTNPPYLAKNKFKGNKEVFDQHNQNDLYKCFMSSLIDSGCNGGIVIIPLNFWCSIRKADASLRRRFMNQYTIARVNVFYEKVFDETGYTVCAIQFRGRYGLENNEEVPMHFYPDRSAAVIKLGEFNDYTIGGDILNLEQTDKFKIERATKSNKDSPGLTNILVKCIDDSPRCQLGLKIVADEDRYIDETTKLSARSYATLVINPPISLEKQKEIVGLFNARMGKWRGEYYSLFLSNYRENGRKRVSFGLVFKMVNFLL